MKRLSLYLFLTLFVLLFSSSVFAEDISDFEIEGMSIGDSALDFFTEQQINKNTMNYYKDKTYTPVQNDAFSFFKTYDAIDFDYKTDDKNYIIQSLRGILIYQHNIEDCYLKMDGIFKEIKQIFKKAKFNDKRTIIHPGDSTGKSKMTLIEFIFESGEITIACLDFAEEYGQDNLTVAIDSIEYIDWMGKNPYD